MEMLISREENPRGFLWTPVRIRDSHLSTLTKDATRLGYST